MSPTVLVVDDSLTVRMDLVEALSSAGLRAIACSTLAEAREAIEREAVALVVLDVMLPDGDGIDFLSEIRAAPKTAEAPVLMLSSEAEVRDRIRGLFTGADDYVGKPYDAGYVVARATELIRRRGMAPSGNERAILVIDDSPTFRQQLRAVLEEAGHRVLCAESGEAGLRLAAMVMPAAILVDGVMPGLDGSAVIRRIRLDAALRATPCILLTGSDEPNAELRALDSGADAFVRKEDLDVVLARLAAVLRTSGAHVADATSLLGPRRILAVDDSPTYLEEVAAMLRGEGYDVVIARSGAQALEILAVQQFDCILLDMIMPGMSGTEVCKRIKATSPMREIPLVMLTALDDREAMIEALSLGADDYVLKSSELEVLRARVVAQMRRKQIEDEHRRLREEVLKSELAASEARAARKIAETRAALVEELERKNQELEAFSYSVSHDLRAPLRAIDGFSRILEEDHGASLDEEARRLLRKIRGGAQRMSELIDALLQLSRIGRAELVRRRVDLSKLAGEIAEDLRQKDAERQVRFVVEPGLVVEADEQLMRVVLTNLMENAWKFTSKLSSAVIEVGCTPSEHGAAFFVRDNGAGFDMARAQVLFRPFSRLHSTKEFPGTGIGLATVRRVIDRHGGRLWAVGAPNRGATVYFTVPAPQKKLAATRSELP